MCNTAGERAAQRPYAGVRGLNHPPTTADLQIVPPGTRAPDEDAVRLLVTGRGGLSAILGDEQQRAALFTGRVRWEQVWLAQLQGKTVGFLAFQMRGRGPYAVRLSDFTREFGLAGGLWRWLLNALVDRRSQQTDFYIYGLKVEPAARRQGVARALVEAALAQAAALGIAQVELEVLGHNERALAFYAALGFERCGRRDLSRLNGWLRFAAVLRLRRRTSAAA